MFHPGGFCGFIFAGYAVLLIWNVGDGFVIAWNVTSCDAGATGAPSLVTLEINVAGARHWESAVSQSALNVTIGIAANAAA